jgi:hypothetical protein
MRSYGVRQRTQAKLKGVTGPYAEAWPENISLQYTSHALHHISPLSSALPLPLPQYHAPAAHVPHPQSSFDQATPLLAQLPISSIVTEIRLPISPQMKHL